MAIIGKTDLTKKQLVEFLNNNGYYAKTESSYENFTIYTNENKNKCLFSSGYTYYDNGLSHLLVISNSGSYTYDIMLCNNGLIIQFKGADRVFSALIVKDGETFYVNSTYFNSGSYAYVCSKFTDTNYQRNDNIRVLGNSTVLRPLIYAGTVGETNVVPNAYFLPITQYADVGVLTLNGENYITNGYWCIKD